MPERDGAAVDVDARGIEAELPHDGERLRGERFVQLEQIDVDPASGPARSTRLCTAGTGPMPMIFGSTPTVA